jgi:2-amino-4-hydroxy-6-hydroxymethyldihydropteridine diphosphokinase
VRAVIGIGGNLGDRLATLRQACRLLASQTSIVDASTVYETAPVGPPQPRYLNAAILIETTQSPRELLDMLLSIEREMGRVRDVRWGPRTIDLDILWIEGLHVAVEGLEVPHPRLTERAFALVPLLEVAPDATDPKSGLKYASLEISRQDMTAMGMLASDE